MVMFENFGFVLKNVWLFDDIFGLSGIYSVFYFGIVFYFKFFSEFDISWKVWLNKVMKYCYMIYIYVCYDKVF